MGTQHSEALGRAPGGPRVLQLTATRDQPGEGEGSALHDVAARVHAAGRRVAHPPPTRCTLNPRTRCRYSRCPRYNLTASSALDRVVNMADVAVTNACSRTCGVAVVQVDCEGGGDGRVTRSQEPAPEIAAANPVQQGVCGVLRDDARPVLVPWHCLTTVGRRVYALQGYRRVKTALVSRKMEEDRAHEFDAMRRYCDPGVVAATVPGSCLVSTPQPVVLTAGPRVFPLTCTSQTAAYSHGTGLPCAADWGECRAVVEGVWYAVCGALQHLFVSPSTSLLVPPRDSGCWRGR